MLVPVGSLKLPSKPKWRMRRDAGSKLEALVRWMWCRVFIRPLVSFVMRIEVGAVRAHSWGKKGEMSFRASVAESEAALLMSVDAMIDWTVDRSSSWRALFMLCVFI